VRTSVGSWEEVDEKLEIEMPLRRGVDAVPGDERRPRKRTSKGREVGECALSSARNGLIEYFEYFEYFELEN